MDVIVLVIQSRPTPPLFHSNAVAFIHMIESSLNSRLTPSGYTLAISQNKDKTTVVQWGIFIYNDIADSSRRLTRDQGVSQVSVLEREAVGAMAPPPSVPCHANPAPSALFVCADLAADERRAGWTGGETPAVSGPGYEPSCFTAPPMEIGHRRQSFEQVVNIEGPHGEALLEETWRGAGGHGGAVSHHATCGRKEARCHALRGPGRLTDGGRLLSWTPHVPVLSGPDDTKERRGEGAGVREILRLCRPGLSTTSAPRASVMTRLS
ncbi:hypothetical protein AAFF_G00266250 [Aldrovandia affinis]|uniref:Uncharacterized protein n=1 Tax=Aldrovandia affinis TaxID=143900 RepID=A0AAD7W2B3_9TELE|nr:hypothetical protein AAFF_G00266250 [Aldrovandia affinis]